MGREEVLERRQTTAAQADIGSEEGAGEQSSNTYYQQLEHRGKHYRLGDGVLVHRAEKPHCDVMRIDRMWRTAEGQEYFSGCLFARPKETRHEASRMFFRREVVAVEQLDGVESFDSVQGRCAILTLKQYETCKRSTNLPLCFQSVSNECLFILQPDPRRSPSATCTWWTRRYWGNPLLRDRP